MTQTTRSYISLFVILLVGAVLTGCAAKKALKKGNAAKARGDMYGAAIAYLQALDEKSGYEDAVVALRNVAKPAYNQKRDEAEGLRSRQEFDAAIREYENLAEFTERMGFVE